MRLLIVEDEPSLKDSIQRYLKGEGYICDTAATLDEALDLTTTYDYDVAVVDIMLGEQNGFEVIKTLKLYRSEAGIIIISAKDSLDDKIEGLDLGSDDYLTKPFHLAELNARIRAVIRRKKLQGFDEIVYKNISINTTSKDAYINGERVLLTPKEFDMLLFFMSNKEKVITKTSLSDHLWQDDFDFGSYDFIYSLIKNLRKKLNEKGADYLQTIYGVGYKFQQQ